MNAYENVGCQPWGDGERASCWSKRSESLAFAVWDAGSVLLTLLFHAFAIWLVSLTILLLCAKLQNLKIQKIWLEFEYPTNLSTALVEQIGTRTCSENFALRFIREVLCRAAGLARPKVDLAPDNCPSLRSISASWLDMLIHFEYMLNIFDYSSVHCTWSQLMWHG